MTINITFFVSIIPDTISNLSTNTFLNKMYCVNDTQRLLFKHVSNRSKKNKLYKKLVLRNFMSCTSCKFDIF